MNTEWYWSDEQNIFWINATQEVDSDIYYFEIGSKDYSIFRRTGFSLLSSAKQAARIRLLEILAEITEQV